MDLSIKGLSHITFVCGNLEKTAHMLREVFGAKEIYCSGDKTFSISKEKFFLVDDIWIAIMEGNSVEKTYNHIAFQVKEKDLAELEAKVLSLNLTILPGRKRDSAEGKSLYFYDYDNHLFELHTGELSSRLKYYGNENYQKFDVSKIELMPATLKEYPVIQNMGRFYVYDMSEYLGNEPGWEIPADGLYECIDFKKYWEDQNSFPFLMKYQNEMVGFVIIDKKGSDPNIDFNMAQFFILRKFKNKGIGSFVAQQCFKKFPGNWEVMVMPENEGAYHFWKSTIKKYTGNNFAEYMREIPHFNNNRKNIFNFDSDI